MKLMARLRPFLNAIWISALIASPVEAGQVIYRFVGTALPNEPVTFQLTVPDFVNPPLNGSFTTFACAQLDSSTHCQSGLPASVFFSNQSALGAFSAVLQFDADNNSGYVFYFPAGAFGVPGVYNANTTGTAGGNPGTLTVTEIPSGCAPPAISAVASSPGVLWPPNYSMVPATVTAVTSGGCGAVSCKITSVSSNEPVGLDGDWIITGDLSLSLRATRSNGGSGRIYSISVQCTDDANHSDMTAARVIVPHDQGK